MKTSTKGETMEGFEQRRVLLVTGICQNTVEEARKGIQIFRRSLQATYEEKAKGKGVGELCSIFRYQGMGLLLMEAKSDVAMGLLATVEEAQENDRNVLSDIRDYLHEGISARCLNLIEGTFERNPLMKETRQEMIKQVQFLHQLWGITFPEEPLDVTLPDFFLNLG